MGNFKNLDIELHNDMNELVSHTELIIDFIDSFYKKYGQHVVGEIKQTKIYLDFDRVEYIEKKGNKITIKLK